MMAGDGGNQAGQQQYPGPARQRSPVAAILDITRANHHIGLAFQQGIDQTAQIQRVMLAVAIAADDHVVALLAGKDEASLHRSADADVMRHVQHDGPGGLGNRAGLVA